VKNLGRQSLTEIQSQLERYLEANAVPNSIFPLFDRELVESSSVISIAPDQSSTNIKTELPNVVVAETSNLTITGSEMLGMTLAQATQIPNMTAEKWGDFVAEYKAQAGVMKTRLDNVSVYGHSLLPLDPTMASRLSTRTRRALERAGIYNVKSLERVTVQDLIAIRQIGRDATVEIFRLLPASIVTLPAKKSRAKIKELKSKIDALQTTQDSMPPERARWKALQEALANELGKGRLDRRLQIGRFTLGDLLRQQDDQHSASEILLMCHQIEVNLKCVTIDDELREILTRLGDRKINTLLARFGRSRQTLQEVADRLGLTRERVRQLENKSKNIVSIWLEERSPCRIQTALLLAEQMKTDISLPKWRDSLIERGLMSRASLVDQNGKDLGVVPSDLVLVLLQANQDTDISVRVFKIPDNLLVAWEQPGFTANEIITAKALSKQELRAIRRQCRNAGAVSAILVGRKLKMSASAIRKVLELHGFIPLNEEWLMEKRDQRLPISSHYSAFQFSVTKLLSVCGSLSLEDVREGVQDHISRFDFATPPTVVLRKLLPEYGFVMDAFDFVALSGKRVPIPHPNSGEKIILKQIRSQGPVVNFQELSEAFSKHGRSQPLLATALRHSVLFRRVDDGLYILRGTKITREDVESAARRRPVVEHNGSLHYSSDGTITWAINVGSYALGGTIPTGQAARLIGEWTSRTQGIDTGKIKVGEQQIWGLAKAFRKLNVIVGERIALRFNPATRQVRVEKLEKENHEEE
jgi:transcriptional regulator with XRE-family HTH domain/ribosomal 50S subunit-recycling heat shock protein